MIYHLEEKRRIAEEALKNNKIKKPINVVCSSSLEIDRKESCRNKTRKYLSVVGVIVKNIDCQVTGCRNKAKDIHHWDYNDHYDFSLVCHGHHCFIHSGDKDTLKNVKKY